MAVGRVALRRARGDPLVVLLNARRRLAARLGGRGEGVVIGAALSVASTMVLMRFLIDRGDLTRRTGRRSSASRWSRTWPSS